MRKKYKTKFPVARIKKIMQKDEDVGKVAQATPILISKALELFMQSLIDEACLETRAKNAKRLTVAHLKKTVLEKDQFDFLRDIVENVQDPSEHMGGGGGGGASSAGGGTSASIKDEEMEEEEEEEDEEEDSPSPPPTKKAPAPRGKGRGKAAAAAAAPVPAPAPSTAPEAGRRKGKAPVSKVKDEDEDDYDEE